MATTTGGLEIGKSDAAEPTPPIIHTYDEARKEATRRSKESAINGLVSRVVKSCYGGYAVRTLPVEILADMELRLAAAIGERRVSYTDLL